MSRVLALIPARGGSKGVSRKNMRPVAGKPLFAHSVAQALETGSVDDVIVSSDDDQILRCAAEYGAIALRRPERLALDDSPVIDAVVHAVGLYGPYDTVVLLQPTSPLREVADISRAIELFQETGVPVCSVFRVEDTHPARMYTIAGDPTSTTSRMLPLMPDFSQHRRQDLPPMYLRNGAIYVFGNREINAGQIIGDQMVPYIMPLERSINVDTELDMALLKLVMEPS